MESVESRAPAEWQSLSSERQRTVGGRRTAGATGQSRHAVDGLLVRAVRPAGAQPAKHRARLGKAAAALLCAGGWMSRSRLQSGSSGKQRAEGRGQREA